MNNSASPLAAFHLLGDRTALEPTQSREYELRPAVFGPYHDLSLLRFDFPVVLANQSQQGVWIKSLADIIDELLIQTTEPGTEGEEVRRQVLALEQNIRSMLSSGQKGTLSLFWEGARRRMTQDGDSHSLDENLHRVRAALEFEGELVDCDRQLAAKLLHSAWHESESMKAERLSGRVNRLTQKLSDILKVNYGQSPDARQAKSLENTMGSDNQAVFDFQAMARILRTAPTAEPLSKSRHDRINDAITVLGAQRFVSAPGKDQGEPYEFCFDNCQEAYQAWHLRLPEIAALVKAISIAELEIENRYDETLHDEFFARFDESRLGPADLEPFPSYLLCLEDAFMQSQDEILDILRRGLPFKILVQTLDILIDDSISGARLSFGTLGQQLARMAMSLENVFVLQVANSGLYHNKEAIERGLASDRPALFSVFAAEPGSPGISPYLQAAAATESRAFPTFCYDPAAGDRLSDRFTLEGNPATDSDWVAHRLNFEDVDHGTRSEDMAFTVIDFIAADPRFCSRFASVLQGDWGTEMVPVSDFLEMDAAQRSHRIPYIHLIDEQNVLRRAVFDDHLIDAAERCLHAWQTLQELAGIHNSHVEAALSRLERETQPKAQLAAPDESQVAQEMPATTQAPAAAETAEPLPQPAADPEPSSDDPWIETIRCTTCNECTELNDRMFAYNDDKRAYVADPDAGTYREMVEAAETCQVAIIHPGQPRNSKEPGLEELLVRAEPFN